VKQNLGLRDILDKVRAATRRMRQGRRTMEQLPYFGDAISHQAKLMEYPARMALPAMAACDSIRVDIKQRTRWQWNPASL
jgi:hypothetical protein